MEKFSITKGLAVGMAGIGGYEEEKYAQFVSSHTDSLLPVAFFDVNSMKSVSHISGKCKQLVRYGYRGIKLHPRWGNFTLGNKFLPDIIRSSNDNGMPVLLCTYFYSDKPGSYQNNSVSLLALLEKVSNEKMVLLHGGGINLLEYMEIVRAFRNTVLDLSFTFLKFRGSSIVNDIKFLLDNFDKRICIGSDHPEFSPESLRSNFDRYAASLTDEKAANIASKNLIDFFRL
jgi:predicted TIM-barrel fold metal-dependent hydrolase